MKVLILVLSMVLFSIVAPAQSATVVGGVNAPLSWAASTTYTDGTAIKNVLSYHVHAGAKSAEIYLLETGALSAALTNQAPGTCYIVYAVDGTVSSVASNEVCLPLAPLKPSPVTLKLAP